MMTINPWNIIGWTILVVIGAFAFWAINDDTQCATARAQLDAYLLCDDDEKCIMTVDDYAEINYYVARASRVCDVD